MNWQNNVLGPRIRRAALALGLPHSVGAIKTFWQQCAHLQRKQMSNGGSDVLLKADADALVRASWGGAPKNQVAARRLLQRRLRPLIAANAAIDFGDSFRVIIPCGDEPDLPTNLRSVPDKKTEMSPTKSDNLSEESRAESKNRPAIPHKKISKVSRRGLNGVSAPRKAGRFCKSATEGLDEPPCNRLGGDGPCRTKETDPMTKDSPSEQKPAEWPSWLQQADKRVQAKIQDPTGGEPDGESEASGWSLPDNCKFVSDLLCPGKRPSPPGKHAGNFGAILPGSTEHLVTSAKSDHDH